jgi:excinuclease ABC subunit A
MMIRECFASIPEARAANYNAGYFSFNVKGGRCETCEGDGVIKVEMVFMPDLYINCDSCGGKRFNQQILQIKYRGYSIADVLNMSTDEAFELFHDIPLINEKLFALQQVGLGYLQIGQAATMLSGGEAQRIKLAKELSKRTHGRTLYVLDEPTTGLHSHDIKKLLEVLHTLVDKGNTVLVIEHNLDVIKNADYILDFGPHGGNEGGEIIARGTPEDIVKVKNSLTGQYLKAYL